ncbi:TOL, partial [Fusarium albosuccineum]
MQHFDNSWELLDDHDFILGLFQSDGNQFLSLFPSCTTALCGRCHQLDVSKDDFIFKDTVFCLKITAQCSQDDRIIAKNMDVIVRKIESGLKISSARTDLRTPTLSLCRDFGTNMEPHNIKVGLPRLPAPGSPTCFDLIRRWLVTCDEQHSGCRSHSPPELKRLPTRLIDVDSAQSPDSIRLHEVSPEDREQPERFKYIALSHRWGDKQAHKHFPTTTDNVDRRRKEMPVDTLPRTFRDAVNVTRRLGVRYLWIDSICIVQEGHLRDFETEAKHMETVLHLAYVVIAASRTTGTSGGFLGSRPERKFVILPTESEHSMFVCENIDNFQQEIVEGEMNKRGWVLQERALAQRTIYFGGVQTYWECGEGVRCETLTKMKNNKEEFLGDPNFPEVALNSTKGGRIRLIESLYKQYSTLEFTRDYDRPLAIAGLEQRLIRAFNTKGGYGVFQLYLGRTLLWKRGPSTTLRKIDFPPEQKFQVPSWSWMAYSGAIDFVDAPFDEVDWSENLEFPWESASQWTSSTGDPSSSNVLHTIAWDFDEGKGGSELTYDHGAPPTGSVMKCVIVGKEKWKGSVVKHQQRHFVLVVTPRAAARKPDEYVRIGADVDAESTFVFFRYVLQGAQPNMFEVNQQGAVRLDRKPRVRRGWRSHRDRYRFEIEG